MALLIGILIGMTVIVMFVIHIAINVLHDCIIRVMN
jgi:hypothetical protein